MQAGKEPTSVPSDSLDAVELAVIEAESAFTALCSVVFVQPETISTATYPAASLMFIGRSLWPIGSLPSRR